MLSVVSKWKCINQIRGIKMYCMQVVLFHHKVYWGNTINGDAPRDLPVLDGDLNQSKINGRFINVILLQQSRLIFY